MKTFVYNRTPGRGFLGCLLFISLFYLKPAAADDWPQFRGPNHDGVAAGPIRTNWNEEPPKLVWKAPLDPGLSSLAVSGGRVFTLVKRKVSGQDREFCVALDAATGQELWTSQSIGIADYPNGGVGSDDGPRSTPAVDGNRVYVLSSYLTLACLDATSGQSLWSKDIHKEYGGHIIAWQNAASPLVEGDLVLVNGSTSTQSLMAFRKDNGELVWRAHNDGLTHASPLAVTLGGVRQAIFLTQSGLVSLAPQTGSVFWRHGLNYNDISVAASPVVIGDRVYASRAYAGPLSRAQAGAVVVQVSESGGKFSAAPVWSKINQLMNHWATPVHFEGHLYGMFGQSFLTFKCVELATGQEKWSLPGFGYGSVLAVGEQILAVSDNAILALVAPNPTAYTELGRFHPINGKCWNLPAVSQGRVYIRTTTEAACVDIAAELPPRLQLNPLLSSERGLFRFQIVSEDGSPIAADRAEKVDIFATSDLPLNGRAWTKLSERPVADKGALQFEDRESASMTQRFYRLEERP